MFKQSFGFPLYLEFFLIFYLFIWLHWDLVAAHRLFLVARAHQLWHSGLVSLQPCEILVPQPGIEPTQHWRPPPVLLPGKSHGWRSLVAAVHGAAKSQTRLNDFTFTFHFHHWRRKWQPTPVVLPGESQGWRSPAGCCLWGRTESDTTEATQQQQQQQPCTARRILNQEAPVLAILSSALSYFFETLYCEHFSVS